MEEKLEFSVSGLTVRGFFAHKNEWVPERGQRLQCHHPGPEKPINVLLGEKSVGSVCKEAPNGFKDWLKEKGNIEAVVEDYPKRHRFKGEEVPIIYVLTGKKDNLHMNIKREIENDVRKKQKKKKSLQIEDGDSSRDIKNLVPDGFEDENEINFSILGMHVRGFHKHMEDWFPEKGQRCRCSISSEKSVEVSYEGTSAGSVETEGQRLFRKFIEAGGVIIAVVTGDPNKHISKGKQVPVTYVLKAEDWTNELKNIRNEIKKDVEKRSKKKKSLKMIPGDVTLKTENSDKEDKNSDKEEKNSDKGENNSDNQLESSDSHLPAGPSRVSKKEKAILKEQTQVATDGSGEGITQSKVQTDKISRKRRSDESGDTVVKKLASSEQVQGKDMNGSQAGSILQIEPHDDKIFFEERDFSKMSQMIAKNLMLFGVELGLTHARIEQFEMAHPKEVSSQVFKMLKEWQKKAGQEATLHKFLEAMKHCPEVTFQQPQLNEILLNTRKQYVESGRTILHTECLKTE